MSSAAVAAQEPAPDPGLAAAAPTIQPGSAATAEEVHSHDTDTETGPPPPGSRFERAVRNGREVFGKWFGKAPGLDSAAPGQSHLGLNQAAPGTVPNEPSDPGRVRRCVSGMAKALRKCADKIVYRKALEASEGDKAFARQITDETSATEDECDAIGEVTEVVLKELGLEETKYLPLIASLTVVAGCGARYAMTVRSLDRQIKLREAKEHDLKAAA